MGITEELELTQQMEGETKCAVCSRSSVQLYKYEFGQKPSYYNWQENIEIVNPNYACIYLCGTDYNLAATVRKKLEQTGVRVLPARILEEMIAYRNFHPIRRK